ncbi:unnamed protein product [Rhodiola kirilowii]
MNSIKASVDWLNCCVVAVLKTLVPVSQLQEELERSELKFNKIFSMGGKRMLVHFNSVGDLEECLSVKRPIFLRRFSHLQKWEEEEVQPMSRSVWLSIAGLPFKAWGEENFKKIAEPLGSFLKMEDRDFRMCGVGRARMLVETGKFERISELLEVVLDGKIFEVAVCEDCFFNGAETDWCQESAVVSKVGDSGASSKSSEGGDVASQKSRREGLGCGQTIDESCLDRGLAAELNLSKNRCPKDAVLVELDGALARVGERRVDGLCSGQSSEFAAAGDSEVPPKAAESRHVPRSGKGSLTASWSRSGGADSDPVYSGVARPVTSDNGAEFDMTLAEFEVNRKRLKLQRRKEANLRKRASSQRRKKLREAGADHNAVTAAFPAQNPYDKDIDEKERDRRRVQREEAEKTFRISLRLGLKGNLPEEEMIQIFEDKLQRDYKERCTGSAEL